MAHIRQFSALARIGFAITAAVVSYPFVRLFDWMADMLYRPTDVKSVADCVAKVCRMAEDHYKGDRRSWASRIRRSGYRRFHQSITFEMLRDEFRRNPTACTAWQGYSDDIRYSPAWFLDLRRSDGKFLAGYYDNDPAKRRECLCDTQEDACAQFLLGFLQGP